MGKLGVLEIFVCHANVGMSSLVSRNDNTLSVGEVSDAGVFKAVELIRHREMQCCSDFCPFFAELINVNLLIAGVKVVSEKELT